MKNPFESKRKKEAKEKAAKKLESYVHQDLKRARSSRTTYTIRCPHCHGHRVMSNSKPCRNCGGAGIITRG